MIGFLLLYGLINSAIILFQAIGFALTFSVSGIANFSYGSFYILAGLITWGLLHHGISLLWAIALSIFLTSLAGFIMYWFVIYRVRGMPMSEVIITFVLGVAILEFLRWCGFVTYEFTIPPIIKGNIFIAGVPVDIQRIIIAAGAFSLILFLYLFARHSKIGLAMRALSQNEETALSLGINTDMISAISVMLGTGLCSLAANLILPLGLISLDTGYDVLLVCIAVTVAGGLGSSLGLLVASVLFGYIQTATTIYLSSKWTMVIYLFAILLVLMIRPSGIFGKFKEIEEKV